MNELTCGALLKQISDVLEKNANNALREQELTISQSGVLVLLDKKDNKTATFKELEGNFGVSQPTMVGLLNRLKQKDLVEILTDAQDKRIKKARLTSKGEEKCKEGYKYMNSAEEMLLKSLTDEEKTEFKRLLFIIKSSLN